MAKQKHTWKSLIAVVFFLSTKLLFLANGGRL